MSDDLYMFLCVLPVIAWVAWTMGKHSPPSLPDDREDVTKDRGIDDASTRQV